MLRRCAARLANPGGVSVKGATSLTGGGFNPTGAWNFWSPVWGSQHDARFEEEYYTRQQQGRAGRKVKPDEASFLTYAKQAEVIVRDSGLNNRDMAWAARCTPDSAIEVEATIVTCQGTDGAISQYDTPNNTITTESREGGVHPMSWVFVPPHKAGYCKYCRTHFKRKKGWSPAFDVNLTPSIGHPPVGGCLDPCLVGKKNGEAVEGAVKL